MEGGELKLGKKSLCELDIDTIWRKGSLHTSSSEGSQVTQGSLAINDPLRSVLGGSLPTMDTTGDTMDQQGRSLQTMDTTGDTMDQQEVVILLVGNEEQDKIGVANMLARGDEWKSRRIVAEVEIFTRTSPSRVVVDTTPLQNIEGTSSLAIARQWISKNSLRRAVLGKFLFVVCVLRWSVEKERCFGKMFNSPNCWVDIFGLIFEHEDAVLILVNTEGNTVDKAMKSGVADFLIEHKVARKNIIYANLTRDGESVRTRVEESVSLGKIAKNSEVLPPCGKLSLKRSLHSALSSINRVGKPFFMEEVSEGFKPWGPERAILFGMTGSGKSTLAQMLTLGNLDSNPKVFASSSGIRGGTKKVESGVGRGWYVVDTPGFGEHNDKDSTITTPQAKLKVHKFVTVLEGTFSHYLYVVKRGRVDGSDAKLWKFFVLMFGKDISDHFSIVVTDANKDWLEENLEDLKTTFEGCRSFLCAEFPPLNIADEEWETESGDVRKKYLRDLEEDLAKLERPDMPCITGHNSKKHHDNETQMAITDARIENDSTTRIHNSKKHHDNETQMAITDARIENDSTTRILLEGTKMFSVIGDAIDGLTRLLSLDGSVGGHLLPDISLS